MRFALAIVSFVVAVVLIGAGIAQRTIFLPPTELTSTAEVTDDASYLVIDSATLHANEGDQQLVIGSGTDTSDAPVFAAYAKTENVLAWVGNSPYAALQYDAENKTLAAVTSQNPESQLSEDQAAAVLASEENIVDPAGSDLWIETFEGTGTLTLTSDIPEGFSMIIASDGEQPAPSTVTLSWPVDNATPLAGPLLTAGIVILAIGLFLLFLGFRHLKRSQGPRRKVSRKLAKLEGKSTPSRTSTELPATTPKPEITSSVTAERPGRTQGRKRRWVAAVPLLVIPAFALSACSADYWPQAAPAVTVEATPSTTAEATPAPGSDIASASVTPEQVASIVAEISSVADEADKDKDVKLLKTRFSGPALELREANYEIGEVVGDYTAPVSIPAKPLLLTLPQATNSWPRLAFAIVQDEADETAAPVALMMRQDTPRDNYSVYYAVSLQASLEFPSVANAEIGAAQVLPDSVLLSMSFKQLVSRYTDILTKGDDSKYLDLFDEEGDTLREQVGAAYKDKVRKALGSDGNIEFSTEKGPGESLGLATEQAGGIVAINFTDTETVTPAEGGGSIEVTGVTAKLLGTESTETGTAVSYGYQLLFYVPPAGSTDKVQLLGFDQGLLKAEQL